MSETKKAIPAHIRLLGATYLAAPRTTSREMTSEEMVLITLADACEVYGLTAAEVVDDLCSKHPKRSANVYAAAPELLEALDELSLVIGLTAIKHEGQRAVLQKSFDKARTLIAAVKGETNE